MNLEQALALLRSIDLGTRDHAIFGSGPLLVRDIVAEIGDIDILARGPAWERALAIGELITLPDHGISVVALYDSKITVGRSWAIGNIDVDEAIDTADMISGFPWVRLELVCEYKRAADRPKDRDHLRLLEAWANADGPGRSTTLR